MTNPLTTYLKQIVQNLATDDFGVLIALSVKKTHFVL
jgi:hypothetical protein